MKTTRLTRRELLLRAALGGMSALLAGCAGRTEPPAAQVPPNSPTPLPPTSLPPTARLPTTLAATPAAPSPIAEAEVAAVETPLPTAGMQAHATAAQPPSPSAALATGITQAAKQFLAALDREALTKATYAFGDPERLRWHWTLPRNFPRNGLPLRDMNPDQRALALALLRTSVSDAGYRKALDIMSLQRDLGNDPELYYITVFGSPGGAEPWGWRFEGHHLSRHITLRGDQIAAMPLFNGAWPNVTDAGLRAMEREEDAARELVRSLDEQSRAAAIFQARTLTNHVTQNQAYVGPLEPVGIGVGDLSADQQQLVREIVLAYVGGLPEPVGTATVARIDAAGLASLRFGWAGSLEPRRAHYYRLQGPSFLLEFDNSRNGGTHIHSVWRAFADDFGQQLV